MLVSKVPERGEQGISTLLRRINGLFDSRTFLLVKWSFVLVRSIDIEFCYEQWILWWLSVVDSCIALFKTEPIDLELFSWRFSMIWSMRWFIQPNYFSNRAAFSRNSPEERIERRIVPSDEQTFVPKVVAVSHLIYTLKSCSLLDQDDMRSGVDRISRCISRLNRLSESSFK